MLIKFAIPPRENTCLGTTRELGYRLGEVERDPAWPLDTRLALAHSYIILYINKDIIGQKKKRSRRLAPSSPEGRRIIEDAYDKRLNSEEKRIPSRSDVGQTNQM